MTATAKPKRMEILNQAALWGPAPSRPVGANAPGKVSANGMAIRLDKKITACKHQECARATRRELAEQKNSGNEVGHEYDGRRGWNEAVEPRQR